MKEETYGSSENNLSNLSNLSTLRTLSNLYDKGGDSMEGQKGTIITVFSTAYAVGKTLLAINLAAELARNGERVCLVDLDLQFGDVCYYLKLHPKKTIADAEKSLRNHPYDTVAAEFLTPYRAEGTGFDVMANPKLLEEAYNMDVNLIHDIILQLQLEYDYVIIDTTSTFSALNLSIMDMSTLIDFIGIVDFIPTIKNMKSGADTLKELGYENTKIRYVLNRSNAKTKIDVKDVEAILGRSFNYVISNDFMTARKSIRSGIPLVIESKDTQVAREIRSMLGMSDKDSGRKAESNEKGWLSRLFS